MLGGAAVALAAGIGTGPGAGRRRLVVVEGLGDRRRRAPARRRSTWTRSYGSLDWPETAAGGDDRRRRPRRGRSARSAWTGFDGNAFTLVGRAAARQAIPIDDGIVRLPWQPGDRALDAPETIQRITLVGTRTPIVLASGRMRVGVGPVLRDGRPGRGRPAAEGRARPGRPLRPAHVASRRRRPTDLVAAPALTPAPGAPPAGPRCARSPDAAAIEIPLWGSGLPGPTDARARGVRGRARPRPRAWRPTPRPSTPRSTASRPTCAAATSTTRRPRTRRAGPTATVPTAGESPPPLADFLLNGRRGFCQHFAGGMAVMLRTLGHPGARRDRLHRRPLRRRHRALRGARPRRPLLGRGLVPGPGLAAVRPHARAASAPNPASVSSPDYAPEPFEVDLGGLVDARRRPRHHRDARRRRCPRRPSRRRPRRTTPPRRPLRRRAAAAGGGGCSWRRSGCCSCPPALRTARRSRARTRGDERDRVIAAARELEASLRRSAGRRPRRPPPRSAPRR